MTIPTQTVPKNATKEGYPAKHEPQRELPG